jgi:DNA-directed RNA polymerase subunit N (RpoN/RPB10)
MQIIPKKYRKCRACGKKLSANIEKYKERCERQKILIKEKKELESDMVTIFGKINKEDTKYTMKLKH